MEDHSSTTFGEIPNDASESEVEGDYQKLFRDYKIQKKELTEMRMALEETKRANQEKRLKSAVKRKSMHVGSLAFAIEGQVREEQMVVILRDLTRKLKILKMEHNKLAEEALTYENCLGDMKEMSSTIHSTLNQQIEFNEDLKTKFIEGAKERKELYNKVLELKGNIRVFCPCRPLNSEELAAGASMVVDFESAKDGELSVKSNGVIKKTFKFDAVFCPQTDQADVSKDTAPFAASVLDWYNVCIFAYSQTGTGKTFTMEGTEEAHGANFRILEELFHIIGERQKLHRYSASVSVLGATMSKYMICWIQELKQEWLRKGRR